MVAGGEKVRCGSDRRTEVERERKREQQDDQKRLEG